MNKNIILLINLLFFSCGSLSTKKVEDILTNSEERFNYTDKNGQFILKSASGLEKKSKTFFTKKILEIPGSGKEKILEQSIVISSVGILGKKMSILRPKISQYHVWFDGKKYSSELKINSQKKAVDIKMTSPESQWNGKSSIKFPSTKKLSCFFSQVIECAKISGFISKAIKEKNGVMNFLIIWEGYPYLNETFSDFPSELFSTAQLEYDGQNKKKETRFNLTVAGQSLFYVLNEKKALSKMFWVSQGITVSAASIKNKKETEEEKEEDGFE